MLIEQPPQILRMLYPSAMWRMDKNEKSVYLTFDDYHLRNNPMGARLAGQIWHKSYFLHGR